MTMLMNLWFSSGEGYNIVSIKARKCIPAKGCLMAIFEKVGWGSSLLSFVGSSQMFFLSMIRNYLSLHRTPRTRKHNLPIGWGFLHSSSPISTILLHQLSQGKTLPSPGLSPKQNANHQFHCYQQHLRAEISSHPNETKKYLVYSKFVNF